MTTSDVIGRKTRRAAARGWAGAMVMALALTAPASSALAGSLTVQVRDPSGRPISDAVVTLRPVGGAARPMRVGTGYRVEQRNIQFSPFVSVVPVGASVSFPNLDPVRHHVYSFSEAKRFEFKLFARDEQRTITFDRAGVVAVGCNIHDQMSAYVFVTDTEWTARSGASGAIVFNDTPERQFTLTVWHPFLRAPGNSQSQTLAAAAQARTQTLTLRLRPPPLRSHQSY